MVDSKVVPSSNHDWSRIPPEILRDILSRIESDDSQWPSRQNVISASGVCRAWRAIMWDLVANFSPVTSGQITFPGHLKLPGPREKSIECFIKRNCKTGVYTLCLGFQPTPTESGKFLMAARKCGWRPSSTDYIISLDPENFSRNSDSYLGRLRANFLSTKFNIHDSSQPITQFDGSILPAQSKQSSLSLGSQWVTGCASPTAAFVSPFPSVSVAYALNVLGTRGPRRIQCTVRTWGDESFGAELDSEANGELPRGRGSLELDSPGEFSTGSVAAAVVPLALTANSGNSVQGNSLWASRGAVADCSSVGSGECGCGGCSGGLPSEPLILKNKPPRWHEQLQCWCLNFRGRVTVASVKNFQLVEGSNASDAEKPVLLQFGKIGKDTFTMDYRHPLSAFQAFAICLSSFDTKVACE